MKNIERRSFSVTELRAVRKDDEPPKIVGYAAVFNKLSEDLGGFREKIAKGAFKDAIKTSDTRALFNHDALYVLGRKSAGTLKIEEDEEGLRTEIMPPPTSWASDLMTSIERGDINQMSFGFRLATDGDVWEQQGDEVIRTLTRVSDLLDVSPVTFPAYPDTSVALRSMEENFKPDSPSIDQDEDVKPSLDEVAMKGRDRSINLTKKQMVIEEDLN
jgi:HK97 family phage prohead protease